jgi:CubicO group peptidase (beta-lactamase class C family)
VREPISDPAEAGVDRAGLQALFDKVAKSVSVDPLCGAQVAVARHGRLAGFGAFGRARCGGVEQEVSRQTLFATYSCTKAIVSSAAWVLLENGTLALDSRVAELIPEFARHGKDQVTLEHLLLHTAGMPGSSMSYEEWDDPGRRLERFGEWKLEWEPGSRFVYHGNSSMWVVAELISRVAGIDYRDFIRTRIAEPLGLRDLRIGLPDSEHSRVADVINVGEPMSQQERAVSPVDAPTIDESTVGHANAAAARRIGSPGGGCIATAADLALFYQGMLADEDPDRARSRGVQETGIWRPGTLRDAWTPRQLELMDPMTGQPALRGLGVVVAGDTGRMWRGFAETCGARSFGHMGAGGQVAWADPDSGLSFVYLTNGAQRNAAKQGATGFQMSTLAVASAMSD